MYLPSTIQDCHNEIKYLHEEIADLKIYAGEDLNSQRALSLQVKAAKIKQHFLNLNADEKKTASVAKILLALFEYKYDRPMSKTKITNMLLSLGRYRDSWDDKIVDVYVCHARKLFSNLNKPDPIITHWGLGFSLSPSGRQFMEQFNVAV